MKHKNMSPRSIAQELGNRVRQARLRADLTQSEVASRSGLSRRTILNAEKGKVQLENLVAILAAMDMIAHLDMFLPVQEISPIQLAKLKGQQRQRASGSKKEKTPGKENKPSW